MALNKALERYNTAKQTLPVGAELELEIRFNLPKPTFVTLYEKCSASGTQRTLECTMGILNPVGNDRKQLIRQASFVEGELKEQVYKYKKSLFGGQVPGFLNYKVSVAEEGQSAPFQGGNAYMRFKTRVSMLIGINWRADFTAVYEDTASRIGDTAKTIRLRMFPAGLTPDNFLATVTAAAVTKYELELEYLGNNPTMADFNVTKLIFEMLNADFGGAIEMQQELAHIAKYVFDRQPADLSQKGVSCQAVALSKAVYYADVFPPVGCWLTVKTDGVRVLVSVRGDTCRVIYGQSMTTHKLEGTVHPLTVHIADGEEVEIDGIKTIQLFDVICIDDKKVAELTFEQREVLLQTAAVVINAFVPCVVKDYTMLTDAYAAEIAMVYTRRWPFPIDGLIFVQGRKDYRSTRHYKWKPTEKNTTDFIAVLCPDWMLGKPPYIRHATKTLYLLFCGIRDDVRKSLGLGFIDGYKTLTKGLPQSTGLYYQTTFSPCENPQAFLYYHDTADDLNGKVIELLRTDNTILGWKFERVRSDREMGNDFLVAERNYFNVLDPFTLEDLGHRAPGYFEQTSPEMRKAPNRLMRFALETILAVYFVKIDRLIDLGCGRGADLFRYAKLGISYGLFVDSDPQALAELVRRRLESVQSGATRAHNAKKGGDLTSRIVSADLTKVIRKDSDNMTVYVMEADLKNGASLVEMCRRFSFFADETHGVVCNMALHYLCGTRTHIEGVLEFIATMLSPGGHFTFVVMDGEKIFNLLANFDKGQSWECREHAVLKYAIRKDYNSRTLQKTGQMISVLLPFAETVTLREEPLCNVAYVKELAAKRGLRCVSDSSVTDHVAAFQRDFIDLAVRLTEDDKAYMSLHRVVCLVKE